MSASCLGHPERAASYRCHGCGELLCEECVQTLGRLLVCGRCGELAVPLAGDVPATAAQRQEVARRAERSDYGLVQALSYPLRGHGLFLYLIALAIGAVVGFLLRYGLGFAPLVIGFGWLVLMIGIQFEIVASTVGWEDELPDWPQFESFGEKVGELLTWIVIALLQWGPALLFLVLSGGARLRDAEPRLSLWLVFAALLWVGTAAAVMAWGAAGAHWRHLALRLDKHLRALGAVGGDALATVNAVFALLGMVLVARTLLARVPLLGAIVAGAIGIYWSFLLPHLVGLLFRRHRERLTAVYEG